MDESRIVSNYLRPEPSARIPSKWWYVFPAVILPISMGVFVAGEEVFLSPLVSLGLPISVHDPYFRDIAKTVATLICIVCGIVISTKKAVQIVKAFGVYAAGFIFWGTAFILAFGQPGVNTRSILEPMFLSGVFGVGTMLAIVAPGTYVLSLFVWMFRTAVEPARRKVREDTVDPARHAASMETMIESRRVENVDAREKASVGGKDSVVQS